jgi:hypothetical protein
VSTSCRSCQAPVRWVRTEGGRAMPLDPEPVDAGNVVIVREGPPPVVRYVAADEEPGPRFTSHFATCPDAPSWRKKP